MNERIHKKEIIRFANSPEGTMIWHRYRHGTTWYLINSTGWYENSYYVVDDEYAEHRKESIDVHCKVEHDGNVETHNQTIDEFNTKKVK